ncbi:putative recombination initiation defect [Trifolium repens]|nr:putative recombination initiation defect [Trifolium repens]
MQTSLSPFVLLPIPSIPSLSLFVPSFHRISEKVQKKNQPEVEKGIRGGRNFAIVIESDEETDGSFSCFEVNATAKGEGNNKSQITNEASQVSQMEVAELV